MTASNFTTTGTITKSVDDFFEYEVFIQPDYAPPPCEVIRSPLMHGPDMRKGKNKMKKDWER